MRNETALPDRFLHCDACHKQKHYTVATRQHPYHFTLLGLSNVYVVGIEILACQCGESPMLPRMADVIQLLASLILDYGPPYSGEELRYIRKCGHKSLQDLSRELAIPEEQLKKLEETVNTRNVIWLTWDRKEWSGSIEPVGRGH